jgi:aspartate kinase
MQEYRYWFGTVIKAGVTNVFAKPVIIVKNNQVLLSLSTTDYSFISEDHLSDIIGRFAKSHVKINVMQTSALSFSVCVDYKEEYFNALITDLNTAYKVKYNSSLTLITIRHYTDNTIRELLTGKSILLEQHSRNTAQLVVR